MQDKETCTDGLMTYIKVPEEGKQLVHELWSTPVIMAKPFNQEFLQKLLIHILPVQKVCQQNEFL